MHGGTWSAVIRSYVLFQLCLALIHVISSHTKNIYIFTTEPCITYLYLKCVIRFVASQKQTIQTSTLVVSCSLCVLVAFFWSNILHLDKCMLLTLNKMSEIHVYTNEMIMLP